jgi:dimeric dUTPase (all-alpha-NTP-PPase superfamily)
MFTEQQFVTIADMQDKMNCIAAGEDWKTKNLDWPLAVMVEATEACNHYGWKWWAKEVRDIPQTIIEVVDVIHFAFSGLLIQFSPKVAYGLLTDAIADMHPAQHAEMSQWDFVSYMKESSMQAVAGNFGFSIYMAVRAAEFLDVSPTELFNQYVAKNVLNKFRKANGYKEGTYIKNWNGVEDNVYLEGILKSFASKNEVPTPAQIETELNAVYAIVLENAKPQPASVEHIQH